jgi:large subunit ribosomal protein L29
MKKKELKGLSKDQLQQKLTEMTGILAKMKFSHGVTNLENPLQLRTLRREIARINTYLSSAE